MRPLTLRFKAFASYRDETFLDFTMIGEENFFLIHGNTGAGKTSILDAIVYALYGGDGTMGGRSNLVMRNANAAPDDLTEVDFHFALRDAHYRVHRTITQKAKRDGTINPTPTHSAALYKYVDGAELLLDGRNQTSVTQAVIALLGLGATEFRQVVLLPQGAFREFLVAEPKTRRDRLRRRRALPEGDSTADRRRRRRVPAAGQGQPEETAREGPRPRRPRPLFDFHLSGHGRVETRSVSVQPLSPSESGFPYCRTLVTVRSLSYSKKTRKTSRQTRRYISSLKPHERSHAQWEALVRGHWAVENKTHWRRDALLAEDRIRSRNPSVVTALSLIANAALFILLHAAPFDPVPEIIERLARHPSKAIALIRSNKPRLKPKE